MGRKFSAVVCLWEWKRDAWQFVESYGMDDQGYPVTPVSFAGSDRNSYDRFLMGEECDEEDDEESAPYVPGRAVTMWTAGAGVCLRGVTSPDLSPWLSGRFGEWLTKSREWISVLAGGWEMYTQTVRQAELVLKAHPGLYEFSP